MHRTSQTNMPLLRQSIDQWVEQNRRASASKPDDNKSVSVRDDIPIVVKTSWMYKACIMLHNALITKTFTITIKDMQEKFEYAYQVHKGARRAILHDLTRTYGVLKYHKGTYILTDKAPYFVDSVLKQGKRYQPTPPTPP